MCLDRVFGSRGGSEDLREREWERERLRHEFLERAEISFRWLAFALDCMDKPDYGGTDFSDVKGLPKGLGRLYRERFQKEVSEEKFRELRPILEAVVAPLPFAPPLSTEALYDTVRLSGWDGRMKDLGTTLETDLCGYMSQCAGLWHLDHRSVAEWLLDGTLAREYACDELCGMTSRAAQLIWAGGVLEREEDLQRMCDYLGLTTPRWGSRKAGHMDIDNNRLHDVLFGLDAWATENGRGGDYRWLVGILLPGCTTNQDGEVELELWCPSGELTGVKIRLVIVGGPGVLIS